MSVLICPLCASALQETPKEAFCAHHHHFDRARQGYLNLLQKQGSGRHGDDRCMVQARRHFLSKGYYAPLARQVAELVGRVFPAQGVLLDVGCGEGYYTEQVYETLRAQGKEPQLTCLDISKEAAKWMARRPFPQTTVVASAFHLPIASASCDLLLNLFAPIAPQEFARVLKPEGLLLRVVPQERHLYGLKLCLYDKPYENPPVEQALEGFVPVERSRLDGSLHLDDPADILALFQMTPYYYKTSRQDQQRLAQCKTLDTELSFALLLDRKAKT